MKVRITEGSGWYADKVGEIIEVKECYEYNSDDYKVIDFRRYSNDPGVCGLFVKRQECEGIPEELWLTKEEALKLAIDGAKVCNATWLYVDGDYVDFDGKKFMYRNAKGEKPMIADGVLKWDSGWKLWTPPTPPTSKFAVGEFAVESMCGNWVRIESMKYEGGQWIYEASIGNNSDWNKDYEESELSKA